MKLNKLLILIIVMLVSTSCNDEYDIKLNFVGDSIVARWPLSETFPSQYVLNYGVSYKVELNVIRAQLSELPLPVAFPLLSPISSP